MVARARAKPENISPKFGLRDKEGVKKNPFRRRFGKRGRERVKQPSKFYFQDMLLEFISDSAQLNQFEVSLYRKNHLGCYTVQPITAAEIMNFVYQYSITTKPREKNGKFVRLKRKRMRVQRLKKRVRVQRLKKITRVNQIFRDAQNSARDKVFLVAIFFATSSLKLWNPPGILKPDGLTEALSGACYTIFQVSMICTLLTAILTALWLIKWKPRSQKEKDKQLQQVQLLIWIGSLLFLVSYMAGYLAVNGNPFSKNAVAFIVPLLIGALFLVVLVAGCY